jgi:predicted metalloendopeptidase
MGLALVVSFMAFPVPGKALTLGEAEAEVLATMDPSTYPCQDFYAYACGGWIADKLPLLSTRSLYPRGFEMARQDVRAQLRLLFTTAEQTPTANSDPDYAKLGNLYAGCKNLSQIESDGLTAFQSVLTAIAQVEDLNGFLRIAGEMTRMGAATLLSPMVIADNLQFPNRYLIQATAGDLGFPDSDVYRRNDRTSKQIRSNLKSYISQTLNQFGLGSEANVGAILAIERLVAKYDQRFGIPGRQVRMATKNLWTMPLSINWQSFAQGFGVEDERLIALDRDYLTAMTRVLLRQPRQALQAYLYWRLVTGYHDYLPSRFRDVGPFAKPFQSRDDTCVDDVSDLMGDLAGKFLVAQDGSVDRAQAGNGILDAVKLALASEREQLSWLLDPISQLAVKTKLDAMVSFMGYPAIWPTGPDLGVGSYLENAVIARRASLDRQLALAGQPTDRSQWFPYMSVQTINAFNYVGQNQMYALAGLVRAPFLDAGYPKAMNFAGLGYVLGHEVIHGFATHGRFIGPEGGVGPLFEPADNRRFNGRAQCFTSQYSRFSGAPGTRVKGKLTLEENLADNGGLHLAYLAFKDAVPDAAARRTFASMTDEQLFFVAYAQLHCEAISARSASYVYSRSWYNYAPPRFRTNGPLMNSPDFARAFSCPSPSAMNPRKKCSLW